MVLPQRSTNYGRCTKCAKRRLTKTNCFKLSRAEKNYYRQPNSSFSVHESLTVKMFIISSLGKVPKKRDARREIEEDD